MTRPVTPGQMLSTMRVISMVPSWTETLIEAGIEVVGRTRFCVHPAERVTGIPVVGGTKDIDWQKVSALNADFLLLDREENPLSFAEESPIRWHATHVVDVAAMARELFVLADLFSSSELRAMGDRASGVLSRGEFFGGILDRWGEWDFSDEVVYLIWKNPWMAAGEGTYISSVLDLLGFKRASLPPGKYPVIDEELLRGKVGLFSSEPYPFAKKLSELPRVCSRGALVNGEKFSWFGIRGIRFLEECAGLLP